MKKIQNKLIFRFFPLIITPIIFTAVICIVVTSRQLRMNSTERLNDSLQGEDLKIETIKKNLLNSVQRVEEEAFKKSVRREDRQALPGILERSKDVLGLHIAEVFSPDGIVLVERHNPAHYGQDESYKLGGSTAYGDPSSGIFITSDQPPPGFLSLSQPQTIVVDIYYQDRFIGVAKAAVSPDSLSFISPAQVVSGLPDITAPQDVQKSLTGPLSTNTAYLCDEVHRAACNRLFPKVAGIIYDPGNFKVYIFIHPDYVKKSTDTYLDLLPPSTAGFSYINQLFAVSTNSTAGDGYEDYSITSDNTWAYKNFRLNLSSSYADNQVGTSSFEIDETYLSVTQKKHEYTLGMLDTISSNFFVNQTILGGQIKTILDTIPNAASGMGMPINLFLNFPSHISVYKEGKLIYTGRYQAGNQLLDTSGFPNGAYPVLIKITDTQGSEKEFEQFFVKTNQLAPLHMPQYYAGAGYLMANRQYDSGVFTELLSTPVFHTGANIRLTPGWGMNLGLLGTSNGMFYHAGADYLQEHWHIQSSLLAGSKGDSGYALTANYRKNRFSIYGNLTRIWHNFSREKLDSIDPSGNDYYYRLLNSIDTHLNLNANYQVGRVNLSFFATLNDAPSRSESYSYGPKFTYELFRRRFTVVHFDLSAAKSKHDSFVLATIRFNLFSRPFSARGSLGYNRVNERHESSDDGISANGAVNWNYTDDTQAGHVLGANAAKNPASRNVGASYQYQNNRMKMAAFGDYNKTDNSGSFNQYGGTFNTHLVYASSSMTLSEGNRNYKSGVLVEVDSGSKDDTFDIYVNTRVVKHLKSKEKVFVSLAPFATYKISVKNNSDVLYFFKRPEHTVTLYPGNMQKISWNAVRKYIIVGRLMSPDNEPVQHAVIHGGVGYNTTDSDGYFQLEASSDTKKFTVTNHVDCSFNIVPPPPGQNFKYIKQVICYPINE